MLRHKREKFLVRIFLPSELRYWLHRNTFLWRIDKRLFSVSRTESSFKMKLSPAVTPRTRLRFLAVSVMFCAILVHIFALEEKLARKLREEDGVSEGTEVGEKQSKLDRDRRTVKNNATPNLSDFANRLKDLEERYNLNSAIRCLISSATFSITWAMFNVGYVPLC